MHNPNTIRNLAEALREARTAATYMPSGEVDLPGVGADWMERAHDALTVYDAEATNERLKQALRDVYASLNSGDPGNDEMYGDIFDIIEGVLPEYAGTVTRAELAAFNEQMRDADPDHEDITEPNATFDSWRDQRP